MSLFILPSALRSLSARPSRAPFSPPLLLPSSLLSTLTPASLAASAFSLFSLRPPPTLAGPRGASQMTGGRLRPVVPLGGGRGAPAGIPAVSRPSGVGGSCAAGRARADAQDAHARPRILCPASAVRASGLGPAIRSRKSEPCQVSAWQIGLLYPPGVLSSVEATLFPWA